VVTEPGLREAIVEGQQEQLSRFDPARIGAELRRQLTDLLAAETLR
jgi:hypothetical protein